MSIDALSQIPGVQSSLRSKPPSSLLDVHLYLWVSLNPFLVLLDLGGRPFVFCESITRWKSACLGTRLPTVHTYTHTYTSTHTHTHHTIPPTTPTREALTGRSCPPLHFARTHPHQSPPAPRFTVATKTSGGAFSGSHSQALVTAGVVRYLCSCGQPRLLTTMQWSHARSRP